MNLKILKLLFCFLFVQIAQAEDWNVVRNDSVRIFYSLGNKTLAEDILDKTNQNLNELSRISGLKFTGEVRIFLAKNDDVWNSLTNNRLPDWSQAVTESRLATVYLQSKSTDGKSLFTVLRHELVHVLIGKNFYQPIIPRWFEEGVALMFSGENFSDHTSILSKANLTNSLLSLNEIENVLKFERSKANLAYAESFLSAKMIVDALGWNGLRLIFKETQIQQNWPDAFQTVLKMDLNQFEWRLQNEIKQKYRWNFILQSELFLWILLPFIAVVVFISIRIRNYKTYRRWEEEENSEEYLNNEQS